MPRYIPRRHMGPVPLRRLLRTVQRLAGQLHELTAAYERLGHLPQIVPPPRLKEITPTELEVWRRIADEKDEKYAVIYTALGMSKRNFAKHAASLFSKLGVHRRPGAARLWVALGMGRR